MTLRELMDRIVESQPDDWHVVAGHPTYRDELMENEDGDGNQWISINSHHTTAAFKPDVSITMAVLLALLGLLTLATSASAECAWVFWETSDSSRTSSTWAVSAWETKQACEQALAQKVQSDSAPTGKGEVRVDHLAGKPRVSWRHGSEISFYTYTCLPDTVDQRAPKGTK